MRGKLVLRVSLQHVVMGREYKRWGLGCRALPMNHIAPGGTVSNDFYLRIGLLGRILAIHRRIDAHLVKVYGCAKLGTGLSTRVFRSLQHHVPKE